MGTKKAGAKRASGAKKTAGGRTGAKKNAEGAAPVDVGGSLRQAHETKDGVKLPKGTQTGTATATGQALRTADKDIPQGDERGSQLDIAGGAPESDLNGGADEPKEGQSEPAEYVVNGSLDKNTVASPSGPIPVAAVATTQEDAEKRLEEHRRNLESAIKKTHRKLDETTVASMGRAEIAAVASDRGYEMPTAGARVSRAAFLRAQDEDQYATEDGQ